MAGTLVRMRGRGDSRRCPGAYRSGRVAWGTRTGKAGCSFRNRQATQCHGVGFRHARQQRGGHGGACGRHRAHRACVWRAAARGRGAGRGADSDPHARMGRGRDEPIRTQVRHTEGIGRVAAPFPRAHRAADQRRRAGTLPALGHAECGRRRRAGRGVA